MNNILSYLTYRDDISFDTCAFNEIDALVFSLLAYVEWDKIVDKEKVLLHDAAKKYFEMHDEVEIEKTYSFSKNIPNLLKQIIEVERYNEVMLSHYQSIFDEDKVIQFAAVVFEVNNVHFIAYRGTDSSMLGWKENLKMTYMDEIDSHELAANYLKGYVESQEKNFFSKLFSKDKFYLGGHSKGGNLAVASLMMTKDVQEKIETVYSFDGPGFHDSFWTTYQNNNMEEKIMNYRPTSSIVGRLMISKGKSIIMDAYESGLAQHDAFYWKCNSKGFIYTDKYSEESDSIEKFIQEKLLDKSEEDKIDFTNMLFHIFDTMKINSINDLSEVGIKQGLSGMKEITGLTSEERKYLLEIVYFVWTQTKNILFTKK